MASLYQAGILHVYVKQKPLCSNFYYRSTQCLASIKLKKNGKRKKLKEIASIYNQFIK